MAGAPATGQFTRLSIGGTAHLGGSIQVTAANGYEPDTGDEFDILTWNALDSEADEFDSVDLPIGMTRNEIEGAYRIGVY